MRDIFFTELKTKLDEARRLDAISSEVEKNKNQELLLDTIQKILGACTYLQCFGYDRMEDKLYENNTEGIDKCFVDMLWMIIKGANPSEVEDMGWVKYFNKSYNNYGALSYLLYIRGAVCIANKENSIWMKGKLLDMLPEDYATQYLHRNDDVIKSVLELNEETHETDKFYYARLGVSPDEDRYFLFKCVDCIITSIDNRSIVKLLAGFENREIALLLNSLSGEARRRIAGNLTQNLKEMIFEELNRMENVDKSEETYVVKRIFALILKRVYDRMLICSRPEVIKACYDIFGEEVLYEEGLWN